MAAQFSDDLLGPPPEQPKVYSDDLLDKPPQMPVMDGPVWDGVFGGNQAGAELGVPPGEFRPMTRILDAMGHGAAQSYGAEPSGMSPETEQYLRDHGIFNDHKAGRDTVFKTFNEAIMRPAVTLGEMAWRAGSAAIGAFQGGAAQLGEEVGLPKLGRDIAALPEAFPQEFGGAEGVTARPRPAGPLYERFERARDLGIVGQDAAADAKAIDAEARRRLAPDPSLAPPSTRLAEEGVPNEPATAESPAAPPPADIHETARAIAPEVFTGPEGYDSLSQRRDTFRGWIDDLAETRRQDAEANAPHAEEIADLKAKMEDATPRLQKKYQARLDALEPENQTFIADAISRDTPDMARVRGEIQKTDQKMRDMAPDVSAAYRAAEERMPQLESPAETVAETPPEPVGAAEDATAPIATAKADEPVSAPPAAPAPAAEPAPRGLIREPSGLVRATPAQLASIADDVTKKLVAAGRPVEEAQAAAQIIAAHYEARAARFNGALGTAEDLYRKEGPAIRAGKGVEPKAKAGELELAQPAYHGSPHVFDKFTTDHIGSGEGAQAYGWGLYFAGNKAVAKYYREQLTRKAARVAIDGVAADKSGLSQLAINYADLIHEGRKLPDLIADNTARLERANAELERYPDSQVGRANKRAAEHSLVALKELQGKTITAAPRGRLYHVELAPKEGELLDWDKPLSEQPDKVKSALRPLFEGRLRRSGVSRETDAVYLGPPGFADLGPRDRYPSDMEKIGEVPHDAHIADLVDWAMEHSRVLHGDRLYDLVSRDPRAASQALAAAGVRGIRYREGASRNIRILSPEESTSGKWVVGERNGRNERFDDEAAARARYDELVHHNYVIFDGADVAIREFEQTKRGKIRLSDARATITLMKDADASTFIHETGHQWLEELMGDAEHEQAPADLKADAQTVRDYLGVEPGKPIPTKAHEKFARSFERYMMEGVAPSKALAGVFAKFKAWLGKIYETVNKLRAPISDDIRAVFDRMLSASPERVVIAPELERGKGFADIHEADAETTPPHQAGEVADTVRGERDDAAPHIIPKELDLERQRERGAEEAGRSQAGSEIPDRGGDAGQSDAGGAGGGAQSRAVGAGGGEAAAEGAGARGKPSKALSPYERLPREPMRLTDYLKKIGGLKDDTFTKRDNTARGRAEAAGNPSDLRAMGAASVKGLIRAKTGRALDDAALKAWEDGYLPGTERPTINDLLDAIDRDLRGEKVYSAKDANDVAAYHDAIARNTEIDRLGDELGIDRKGKTHAEFWDAVAERMSTEKAAAEAESQAAAYEAAIADAERQVKEAVEEKGDAWEPDQVYDAQPRTLEDLENEHRQEESARGADQGPGLDEPPGRSGGGAGAGEEGPGSRGRGAGAGRRAEKTDAPGSANERFADASGDVDKAGNIRLDNTNTPDDVNRLMKDVAAANGDFLAERRGVVTDGDILDFAETIGVDPGNLNLKRLAAMSHEDGIPLGARILAARKIMVQAATDLKDAMAEAARTGSDEAVAAYGKARERLVMTARTVAGITAEWGRAGRGFRNLAEWDQAKDMAAFAAQATGRTLNQLREEAKLGAALETPKQVTKFAQDMAVTRWQKVRAGYLSYWLGNYISGPITHAAYTVGNLVMLATKLAVVNPTAVGIGAVARMAGRDAGVYGREAMPALYGAMHGATSSWGAVLKALDTGVSFMKGDPAMRQAGFDLGESQARRPQSIFPNTRGLKQIGRVLEFPGRAVAAIHTLGYAINYESEIARLAMRTAIDEGLDGDALNARVAKLQQAPTDGMVEAADLEAKRMVLMRRPDYGSVQQKVQSAVNQNVIAKTVIPFMQVSANVVREGPVAFSPLAFAAKGLREDLLGRNGAAAQDMGYARMTVGTAMAAGIVTLAAQGLVTGTAPRDPKERQRLEATGWKEYSFRVGGSYYPYRKWLGAMGDLVAMTADLAEVGHHLSDGNMAAAADTAVMGFVNVILDSSGMMGLSQFMDAVHNWDKPGGDKYFRNLAMNAIPMSVGLNQIARTIDPYRREVHTWIDAARNRIPGLSQGLYPMRDVLTGLPLPGGTQVTPSAARDTPVTEAFKNVDYFPAKMQRKVVGVDLTDAQYDDLTRIAGQKSDELLRRVVAMPGFDNFPREVRNDLLKSAVEGARKMAEGQLLADPANSGILKAALAAKKALLDSNDPRPKHITQDATQ